MRLHVDPVSQTCTVSANCPLSLVKYHFAVLDRFCETFGTTKWNRNKTSFETVSKLFWNYYVSVSFRCAYSLMRDDCWQEKAGVNRCWCRPKISRSIRVLCTSIFWNVTLTIYRHSGTIENIFKVYLHHISYITCFHISRKKINSLSRNSRKRTPP